MPYPQSTTPAIAPAATPTPAWREVPDLSEPGGTVRLHKIMQARERIAQGFYDKPALLDEVAQRIINQLDE
jgi:hypothetical protein